MSNQAISLVKNQPISLSKGLRKVTFSIAWNTDVDMDIHALMRRKGQAVSNDDFIFFGNLNHPTGCISHSGDILDGTLNSIGEEDETITIDLTKVPADRDEILFTADIYDAAALELDFSSVVGSVCKIVNADNNRELATYRLDRDLSGEVCCEAGRLYKENGLWHFEALGKGVPSLASVLVNSGLKVTQE